MTADDAPGTRALQPARVAAYLAGIADPEAKALATAFLHHVEYIPYSTFYSGLRTALQVCITALDSRPWVIALPPRTYGSEWWLTQMLFQHELKAHEPRVVPAISPSDPADVVIIDDCGYSGVNLLSIIEDDKLCATCHKTNMDCPGHDLDPSDIGRGAGASPSATPPKRTFHLVVPYMSETALSSISLRVKGAKVVFYYVERLRRCIFDLDPSLAKLRNEDGELKDSVATALNVDPTTNFVPIYFDHKIAGPMSTATAILEAVVTPRPSRVAIERAAMHYSSHM